MSVKRIAQEARVLYVERHRGWSLLFLLSSLGALTIAAATWEKKDVPATAAMTGVSLVLAVVALSRLLKARLYVIDPASAILTLITRTALGLKKERTVSTVGIKIHLRSRLIVSQYIGKGGGEKRLLFQDIWFVLHGGERWLFDRGFTDPVGRIFAERLAQDLNCGIEKSQKDDW